MEEDYTLIEPDLEWDEKIAAARGRTRMGGSKHDVPQPHVRRWPADTQTPRRVRVVINSWVGASIGARHTYLTIDEEYNYLLGKDKDGGAPIWVKPWDDSEGAGFELSRTGFEREDDAYKVAHFIVDLMFSGPGHKVDWDAPQAYGYTKKIDGD
jgi:hypothetical protein